jgi:nucleotide-binding universal stress UspA family protein
MEIRTILLPTDFSTNAEQACQHGFTLAARENAHVLLLHVLVRSGPLFAETPLPMRDQLESEMQAEAEG